MEKIDGRRLGTWSLRLDAMYCAVLGAAVAIWAGPIASVISLPQPLICAAGITVVVWAGLVLWMLVKLRLRVVLRAVMSVNILAALLVAVCAAAAGTTLALLAVLAIAITIALFAGSQALAIRALPAAEK